MRVFPCLLFLATCALCGPVLGQQKDRSTASATAAEPIEIGSRLELLLDDHLIATMKDLSFRLHSPRPAERVLNFDTPWEKDPKSGAVTSGFVTVFKDGERYRMYYRGYVKAPGYSQEPDQVTCYAESGDGIHWEKPSLGIVEWDGSKENNIILRSNAGHNFSPFIDTRPGTPPAERYKGVGGDPPYAFVSADAIHWRKLHDKPMLSDWMFDSQNIAFWDTLQKRYVFYLRARIQAQGREFRSISRSTSQDFEHWSKPRLIELGDSPPEQLYQPCIFPYFRAADLYLSFPMRLVPCGKRQGPAAYEVAPGVLVSKVSDSTFMYSRDGRRFSRRYLESFLRPGPDPRNWSDHNMMIAWGGPLPTGKNEMSIYYLENFWLPTSGLRRGVLRTDGFVSVHAPYAGGEFTTHPLIFTGTQLLLNFSSSAVGSIRVEIQDVAGTALPGYRLADCKAFYGDDIAYGVCWEQGGDLGKLVGTPLRLRFVMRDADLYSLRLAPAAK